MSVQELIDELMKVEDKSKEIIIVNDTSDIHLETSIDNVIEVPKSVLIFAVNYS